MTDMSSKIRATFFQGMRRFRCMCIYYEEDCWVTVRGVTMRERRELMGGGWCALLYKATIFKIIWSNVINYFIFLFY